jgi:carnitine O-acetyltransferase
MFALSAFKKDQDKTLQFQSSLARLPVPSLKSSLDRYIKSLKPILLQRAQQTSLTNITAEVTQREEWAKDFMKEGGLGNTLQQRLTGKSLPGQI